MNWAVEATSTGISVQAITGLVSLVLGIGAVVVGISKAVKGLRKFSRLLDGFLGDGTSKHPSVPDRLSSMEENQTQFRDDQADLKATVEELKTTVAGLGAGQTEMKHTLETHVDGDAPTWLAEGQAWGNRLDGQVAELGTRVSALEEHASG